MAWFGDSNQEKDTANVNNNVIIGHTVDVQSNEVTVLLTIIAVVKIIELIRLVYKVILKKTRKDNRQPRL